ncbi:AraC family transcriptional regulator [Flavobacterium sp. LBUM151]
MNLGKEILFFFGALGAFNGFILSAYFLFFRKKYLANLFLGALLLALSIRITVTVFVYFNNALPKTYLQIGLSSCLFIGPFLYCFLKAGIHSINMIPQKWKYHLAIWLIVIFGIGILFPYQNYPVLWNDYFVALIFLQWLSYLFVSGFESRMLLQKMIQNYKNATPAEKWFGMIFFGNAIIFLFYFLGFARVPFISCVTGCVSFTFIMYLAFLILLHRKKTDDLFLLNMQKGKKLNPKEASILAEKLEKIIWRHDI